MVKFRFKGKCIGKDNMSKLLMLAINIEISNRMRGNIREEIVNILMFLSSIQEKLVLNQQRIKNSKIMHNIIFKMINRE